MKKDRRERHEVQEHDGCVGVRVCDGSFLGLQEQGEEMSTATILGETEGGKERKR